ncbi:hypothetical protein [Flavobacterium sp. UBA4197]|uniref:hypothetical protein n=1 Tax=Flavobacterium sp. UBA4197 TaxID=1946546 RepID=UPI00258109CA|nr:hypothetical protein [Flavobacterium sp. UBA4197]
MKNLFLKVALLLFLLSAGLFLGNEKNEVAVIKNKTTDFLDNYYPNRYNLGKSLETTVNKQTLIISEILNESGKSISGYIVTSKDYQELLYFADYKRELFEIVCYDFIQHATDLINFTTNNHFESFVKTDLINEIEKGNSSPATAMKFWGTSCGPPFSLEENSCYRNCCYYVLWVNTGCDVVGC